MTSIDIKNKSAVTRRFVELYHTNRAILDAGPKALCEQRADAVRRFEQLGIPETGNEDYKYTNIEPLLGNGYTPAFEQVKGVQSSESLLPQSSLRGTKQSRPLDVLNESVPLMSCYSLNVLDAYTFRFVNGWFQSSENEGLPQGIVAGSIRQIADKNPSLLSDCFNKMVEIYDDALALLNVAYAQDGFLLYIPDGVVLERPILLDNQTIGLSILSSQRNLLIVGENSQARIILSDKSQNGQLTNQLTEMIVGSRSVVDLYQVQDHEGASAVNSVLVRQEKDTNVAILTVTLQGELVRNNVYVELAGEHGECHLSGMSFPENQQHVDNFIRVEHIAPNCVSNQLYKNILRDSATGAFSGRIHVFRDAQKTNAFQRNSNVLLTDEAKMFTKPQLIIDADDVKCSHGATVGRLNEEALFYLRARGIGETDARLMLLSAFSHEIIGALRYEPFREVVSALVEKRLKGNF